MTDEASNVEPPGEEPRTVLGFRRPNAAMLAFGGVAAGVFVVEIVASGEFDDRLGHVLALLLGGVASALSVALLVRRPEPHEPSRGIVCSFFAWSVVILALHVVWLSAGSVWPLFGNFERILLFPVVAALVLGIGYWARLNQWTAVIMVAYVVVGVFGESIPPDWPQEMVAAAGPNELATAQRTGEPIALRSARHDHHAPVAPPPSRTGMHCERAIVRDQRHTLFGAPARELEISADACWTADGKPYTVRVIAFAGAGDTQSNPRSVAIVGADPFLLGRALSTDAPYGAEAVPSRSQDAYNLHPFNDDARVQLGGGEKTIRVRVSRNGRRIELITGWLLADPLTEPAEHFPGAYPSGPSGTSSWPRAVALGFRPRRGEVLDVFTATFDRQDDPDPRLVRLKPNGESTELATQRPQRPEPHIVGTRPTVTITGGD